MTDTAEKLRLWRTKHSPVLELLLDAYCVVDLSNRVVDFNVAFTELCGESYRKVLKIGDFCQLLQTEFCPNQCPARQITSSQKLLRIDELRGSSKAYPQLQIILGGIPIFDDAGALIGSLVTIRNVSAESELQKKYNEKKKDSSTDGLTRLFNKTYAEAALLKLIKGALRRAEPLSVALVDIDHFKKVNDTFGHQAGDYVLSLVAHILKEETRDTDVTGRFGGEEFVVVLANSDVSGARVFSERFRNRIEKTEVLFEGKKIPITVSVGTSTLNEKWQPGTNPEALVKLLVHNADTALYFSKTSGRNRTSQFEHLPPPQKKVG